MGLSKRRFIFTLESSSSGSRRGAVEIEERGEQEARIELALSAELRDRKSTRLNSSHQIISYAAFCLKNKNKKEARSNSTLKEHVDE